MPAAPRPPSQNEMYWKPTLTSLRRPSSVISPGRGGGVEQLLGGDVDVVALLVDLVRAVAEHRVERLHAPTSTTSGCATQVPSKPASASRSLSSSTASIARSLASSSLRDGISAAMPPIANAPRAWQVLTSSSV